jgi:hypothetical protein
MNSRKINTLLAAALAFSVVAATQASAGLSRNGFNNGWQNGINNGFQNGSYNGFTNGSLNGYQNGTYNGWSNGSFNGWHNGVKSCLRVAVDGYGLRVTGFEYLPGAVVK